MPASSGTSSGARIVRTHGPPAGYTADMHRFSASTTTTSATSAAPAHARLRLRLSALLAAVLGILAVGCGQQFQPRKFATTMDLFRASVHEYDRHHWDNALAG